LKIETITVLQTSNNAHQICELGWTAFEIQSHRKHCLSLCCHNNANRGSIGNWLIAMK